MVYKGITTNEQINAYRYNHFKNNCQGKSPFEWVFYKRAIVYFLQNLRLPKSVLSAECQAFK